MAPKKRKTGPSSGVYNTIEERDAAKRKVKRDPFPGLGVGKTGEVATPSWIVDSLSPEKDLLSIIKTLAMAQGRRLWETTFFMSLFANTDFMTPYWGSRGGGMGWGGGGSLTGSGDTMPRQSYNLIRVCTEALAGKLIQSNSRVVFQTRQGDWSEWRKARKLEMAIEGEFHRMRLYQELNQVVQDAIITGDGYLKLYPDFDGKKVCCERVFPNEIFIDELEGAYGRVTKMYQLQYRRKDDIYAWYPDKLDIIRKAGTTMPPRFAWTLYQPGMVEMYEAWALPVGGRPGRHIIAVSSGTLVDEPWEHEEFPIIRFKAGDRPFGWYGAGWVEQVAANQIDLNKTLNVLQRSAHLGIAPYWVVANGASINIDHLTNGVGHIVSTDGPEPKWVTNPPFHEAGVKYAEMQANHITQYFGLNEMETTGELPIHRLDSSQALVEFQNMSSVRHTMLLSRWQDFFCQVAERTCMLASRIAKEFNGYPVMIKKAYAKANQLDWKDLDLPRDAYMMEAAPSNILPLTNAGKIDKIEKWAAQGLLSPAQAARAMMGPADVQAILNEIAAKEDDIDRLIEQFTEFEQYREPTALQLPQGLDRMASARLEYANLGAPDSVIRLFDRWLSEAQDLIQLLQQQQPPQQAGGMTNGSNAGPGAPGAQPPGSPSGPPSGNSGPTGPASNPGAGPGA